MGLVIFLNPVITTKLFGPELHSTTSIDCGIFHIHTPMFLQLVLLLYSGSLLPKFIPTENMIGSLFRINW